MVPVSEKRRSVKFQRKGRARMGRKMNGVPLHRRGGESTSLLRGDVGTLADSKHGQCKASGLRNNSATSYFFVLIFAFVFLLSGRSKLIYSSRKRSNVRSKPGDFLGRDPASLASELLWTMHRKAQRLQREA